jgi:hypothetical protein
MAIDFQQQNGLIGPLTKGGQSYLRSSDMGEAVFVPGASDYYEWTRQGFVFTARSGAAAAIPINTTLTNSPTLWNVASSGKVVVPMFINLSVAAVGTPALQGFSISWLGNTGDGVATGAPIATFAALTPVSNMIGRGACKARMANATVTFTTQPAVLMDIGINHWLEGAAASGTISNISWDAKGSIIMPPGTSISVGCPTTASSTTYWTSIVFAEFPAYLYYNQ